ncbi:SIR2 family protein [Oscillatoria amoena NRMC-F 0135]|nr:SIR2 family protein [Oscillatoria amoena NRMC-F 0135]
MTSNFREYTVNEHAISLLANSLNKGTLVLFLGAGSTAGFGLPSWIQLITSLMEDVGLPQTKDLSNASAEELQVAADEIIEKLNYDKDKLIGLIENKLYSRIEYNTSIFNNHLLIALSTLLMSGNKGHISKVVTLNYDSMLEWLLTTFGFTIKTIYELPTLVGSEDVKIYHPNGYIPDPDFSIERSNDVILSMTSVNERLGAADDAWFEMIRHILNTSICLFIGMSFNSFRDRALQPLFHAASSARKNKPLGIWIIKDDLLENQISEFLRYKIAPVTLSNENEVCDFVLKISQLARKNLSTV